MKLKRQKQMQTNPHQFSIKGLYVVTPNELDTKLLVSKVEAALKGGVQLMQYRNKAASKGLRLKQSTAILAACRAYGVPLIINDHLDLCAQIDADGLHLGQADCKPGPARRLLGADKIIGVSCYNRLDLAKAAADDGASYVAFGACFPSDTKPNAVHAPLSLFQEAKHTLNVPVVGIGGITRNNIQSVINAGADALAVITDIFESKDIATTCKEYQHFF